ncbi:C-type lectin domain family 7 member A-like [Tupaia chinensis]|uniref:C-type lectin domain family 7 member A-like n=1 Tax=Tupaia chinensis TaxID=246437 RepID=UPI000FFB40ED|nr:C-type lectin domain family 7 member A-like [Tupaia chinensis]
MNSMLLKIEDVEELNFIKSQISYFYWIGLSRIGTSHPWTWEDNSKPFHEIFTLSNWKESNSGNCGSLIATKMDASDCSRSMFYICEKKITCLPT